MPLWLQLLLCLAVIDYAGYFLSRYGDIIAENTGLPASPGTIRQIQPGLP